MASIILLAEQEIGKPDAETERQTFHDYTAYDRMESRFGAEKPYDSQSQRSRN
jgi:hypothetical protein